MHERNSTGILRKPAARSLSRLSIVNCSFQAFAFFPALCWEWAYPGFPGAWHMASPREPRFAD